MTQNEAVYMAVLGVVGDVDGKITPNEAQLKEVYAAMMTSFKAGQWTKNSGGQEEAAVLKYIPGLVNNHLRKDLRLNGGTKYETKRPGSRSGSGDESVKAMRTLLSVTSDPAAKQQIQAAIDERIASLKPKTEIKVDALPEALRHLVPS